MDQTFEGYTRVSQILGQWNHLAHIDKAVLENKCRIGQEVHEKIWAEHEGIYLDTSEGATGYFKSWLKWAQDQESKKDFEVIHTEKRFFCDELKITGAIDSIVNYKGKICILDYKTSAQANKKMWSLQASFYHYLALKNWIEVDPIVIFIHLKKDGKKAREIEIECSEDLWEVAKSALHTYRYFNA